MGEPYTTTPAKELGMDKAIELSAESLFAQLKELGVNCRGCKEPDRLMGMDYCPVIDGWQGEDFLCNQWQPNLPLPTPPPETDGRASAGDAR